MARNGKKKTQKPKSLPGLCHARIKASRQVVAKSLVGDYRPEHLFCLQQALESYRHSQSQITACDERIETMLARFDSQEQCAEAPSNKYKVQGNQPAFDVPSEMHRILGVDLTAIPGMSAQGVLTFFCEVGPQITRFPSSRHFASWLGLCPDNRISGGKILSSKTRNVRCRLAHALRMAATTLYRSGSALGDYFRRLRAKHGSPVAITAAAHKLARILFAMPKQELLDTRNRKTMGLQNTDRLQLEVMPLPVYGAGARNRGVQHAGSKSPRARLWPAPEPWPCLAPCCHNALAGNTPLCLKPGERANKSDHDSASCSFLTGRCSVKTVPV